MSNHHKYLIDRFILLSPIDLGWLTESFWITDRLNLSGRLISVRDLFRVSITSSSSIEPIQSHPSTHHLLNKRIKINVRQSNCNYRNRFDTRLLLDASNQTSKCRGRSVGRNDSCHKLHLGFTSHSRSVSCHQGWWRQPVWHQSREAIRLNVNSKAESILLFDTSVIRSTDRFV